LFIKGIGTDNVLGDVTGEGINSSWMGNNNLSLLLKKSSFGLISKSV
jgi:hypothetical protein